MKLSQITFAFAITALLGLPRQGAEAKSESCWEITQTSIVSGQQKVLVSSKALKIISLSNRWILLSKAPDWSVIIFNPYSKIAYRTNLADFRGVLTSGNVIFGGTYLEQLPIHKGKIGTATFLGQRCQTIHLVNPSPPMPEHKNSKRGTFASNFFHAGNIVLADSWSWDEPDIPPQAATILCRIYRLPPSKKIPLRLITLTSDGDKQFEVDSRAIKRVQLDSSEFRQPSGFKLAKTEIEVVNDQRRQGAVNNLIQNWDEWGKIVETGKRSKSKD